MTRAVADALEASPDQATTHRLDSAEAAGRLAQHLRAALEDHLDAVPSKDRPRAQAELTNRLITWLNETTSKPDTTGMAIANPEQPEVLRLITAPRLPGQEPPRLPDVPLLDHDLLANARGEPTLQHALLSELETADRVDAVIAFIRWTGLNLLRPTIERLRRDGVPIRPRRRGLNGFSTGAWIGRLEQGASRNHGVTRPKLCHTIWRSDRALDDMAVPMPTSAGRSPTSLPQGLPR